MQVKVANIKIKDMSPQFLVADIGRSIEFYTKQLGFEVGFYYEDFYASVAKEGYSIHLKLGTTLIGERESRRKNEHLDITFSVEGIGPLYDEVKGKPVEIIQPLRRMPYGQEFYVADPDGYIIAFVETN